MWRRTSTWYTGVRGSSTTLSWSTNAVRFPLSGRLIHSYPSNHSGWICWVGVYQPKNYPLGNSARHRATHSFASTFFHNFPLFFFSLWFAEVLCAGPCARHRGYRTVGLPRPCPFREYGPSAYETLWAQGCCWMLRRRCRKASLPEVFLPFHFWPMGVMG